MEKRPIIALLAGLLAVTAALAPAAPAAAAPPAQTDEVYVVQAGDTLSSIAWRFGVTVDGMLVANGLTDADLILTGQQLAIPIASSADEPGVTPGENETASSSPAFSQVYVVQPGDTLFAIATQFGLTVSEVMLDNGITDPDWLSVGQLLSIPPAGLPPSYPAPFATVLLSPAPVVQGQTLVVRVDLDEPATLSGEFDGRPFHFVSDRTGGWALVGIHALQPTGVYSLTLRARRSDETQATAIVGLAVGSGPFDTEYISVPPDQGDLLDPDLIRDEYARVADVWSQVSPRPLWEGPFALPLATDRITSHFGTRRSYDEGPATSFHAGVDFGESEGSPIYAPVAGRAAFAEFLDVRGGSTLIDHGVGVYTGYWHQSQILVQPGQAVEAGDLIGFVGGTGLSTAPHLHWEVRVAGIAVDPIQWTTMTIP